MMTKIPRGAKVADGAFGFQNTAEYKKGTAKMKAWHENYAAHREHRRQIEELMRRDDVYQTLAWAKATAARRLAEQAAERERIMNAAKEAAK